MNTFELVPRNDVSGVETATTAGHNSVGGSLPVSRLVGIYNSVMTAQLVLQFTTAEELGSYDRLIRFEDALISLLGKSAHVDGHDSGSGEMNIFVITEDPVSTFALIQQTDESARPSQEMKAAYRPIGGDDFICLWPPGLEDFDVI